MRVAPRIRSRIGQCPIHVDDLTARGSFRDKILRKWLFRGGRICSLPESAPKSDPEFGGRAFSGVTESCTTKEPSRMESFEAPRLQITVLRLSLRGYSAATEVARIRNRVLKQGISLGLCRDCGKPSRSPPLLHEVPGRQPLRMNP